MIRCVCILVWTVSVACAAGFLSPPQKRYLAHSSKVVSSRLEGSNIVYTVRSGGSTSVRTQAVRRVVGFVPPERFSLRSIVRELKAAGKWPLVRDWLRSSDWEDEWLVSTYLAADDPLFVAATNAVVGSALLSLSELQEVLSRSAWTD